MQLKLILCQTQPNLLMWFAFTSKPINWSDSTFTSNQAQLNQITPLACLVLCNDCFNHLVPDTDSTQMLWQQWTYQLSSYEQSKTMSSILQLLNMHANRKMDVSIKLVTSTTSIELLLARKRGMGGGGCQVLENREGANWLIWPKCQGTSKIFIIWFFTNNWKTCIMCTSNRKKK